MTRQLALGAVLGVTICAAVAILLGRSETAYAQLPPTTADGANGTVIVNVDAAGGGQFVVVVDTTQQVIGSYHVNPESGNIALRSVRNYRWDFQMEEFNGVEPRPHEVRAIVEKR